jgi:hypothetical protein
MASEGGEMNPSNEGYTTARAATRGARRAVGLALVVVLLGGFGLTGCGIISKVKSAVDTAERNKATMDSFTNKIQAGPTTFEATYVTTGSSPATVVYAVQPPNGLSFSDTPSGPAAANGPGAFRFIVNPSGEYACTPPSSTTGSGGSNGSSSKWACEKLPKASAADYNNILDFYTPTHWVNFLKGLSIAAGLAGDKVSTSSKTVNGFAMSCVDLVASGEPGTSSICTTAQNILGYVKVGADATSFEITHYSTSPASSMFQLPPGATVTTVTIPSSTTTTTS